MLVGAGRARIGTDRALKTGEADRSGRNALMSFRQFTPVLSTCLALHVIRVWIPYDHTYSENTIPPQPGDATPSQKRGTDSGERGADTSRGEGGSPDARDGLP
jgi:hypothetical protein